MQARLVYRVNTRTFAGQVNDQEESEKVSYPSEPVKKNEIINIDINCSQAKSVEVTSTTRCKSKIGWHLNTYRLKCRHFVVVVGIFYTDIFVYKVGVRLLCCAAWALTLEWVLNIWLSKTVTCMGTYPGVGACQGHFGVHAHAKLCIKPFSNL